MNTDLRRHRDLILELDSLFPLKHFAMTTPIDQVRWESGERAVVEFLLRELKHQEEEATIQGTEVLRPPTQDYV